MNAALDATADPSLSDAQLPVDAVVVRVGRVKPDSGWTVMSVNRAGNPESWVGIMPELREGLPVRAMGKWEDSKFGRQFRVQSIVVRMPEVTDPDAVAKFLSKLGAGVGERLAQRIVETLGADTIPCLETDVPRVAAVRGVGPERAAVLAAEWTKHSVEGQLMIGLARYSIRGALAKRVIKRYGGRALEICEKRPYLLALEVDGIGFKTADVIARACNVPFESMDRREAGLMFVLEEQFSGRGHCFALASKLVAKTAELLDLEEGLIVDGVQACVDNGRVVREGDRIFPEKLHRCEVTTTYRVVRLLKAPPILRRIERDPMAEFDGGSDDMDAGPHLLDGPDDGPLVPRFSRIRRQAAPAGDDLLGCAEEAIVSFQREKKMELAAQQKAAVRMAMQHKVMALTGGPGVGKTASSKAILYALETAGFDIALCAPTGRAAKRLSESTGRPASTIHRLLEYHPEHGFQRNAGNPLRQTAILLDEVSMCDIALTSHLLDAIDDGARLILVGDVDQLPSVGPGAVLRDLIDSGIIPVVRLTEIFRQAATSRIIVNAHRVNQGLAPELEPPKADECDFFWLPRADAASAAATSIKIMVDRLAKRGISTRDAMIITPQKSGKAGVKALNVQLQQVLNPQGPAIFFGKEPFLTVWRVGDRVMQLKNDYEREVWNGDIGWIKDVEPTTSSMIVTIEGETPKDVKYEKKHFEHLAHAYACTGHKMQGSQAKAIIVIMLKEHYMLLSRSWLYTAISRGEKLVVLIADPEAVRIAIGETRREQRDTGLVERLKSAAESSQLSGGRV